MSYDTVGRTEFDEMKRNYDALCERMDSLSLTVHGLLEEVLALAQKQKAEVKS